MKHFALIGYPLSHSFSQDYFEKKFESLSIDASYKNFELTDLNDLLQTIVTNQLDGFNVTIPYKEKVLKYLDEIKVEAKNIGAVNCVKVDKGKLIGYNTDVIGFQKSLRSFLYQSWGDEFSTQQDQSFKNYKHIKALVFGSGGAAKAVAYSLQKMKIPYMIVSRNDLKDSLMYSDLNPIIFDEYKLLINTTPVGMYPDIENKLPLPYHLLNETHYAYDLIYNPKKTTFLTYCEGEGAQIKNGYEMLTIQADESFLIFQNGR